DMPMFMLGLIKTIIDVTEPGMEHYAKEVQFQVLYPTIKNNKGDLQAISTDEDCQFVQIYVSGEDQSNLQIIEQIQDHLQNNDYKKDICVHVQAASQTVDDKRQYCFPQEEYKFELLAILDVPIPKQVVIRKEIETERFPVVQPKQQPSPPNKTQNCTSFAQCSIPGSVTSIIVLIKPNINIGISHQQLQKFFYAFSFECFPIKLQNHQELKQKQAIYNIAMKNLSCLLIHRY
ncbi:MAG: hypothetical protein EZS28_049647, partial [Streblomastix strix]